MSNQNAAKDICCLQMRLAADYKVLFPTNHGRMAELEVVRLPQRPDQASAALAERLNSPLPAMANDSGMGGGGVPKRAQKLGHFLPSKNAEIKQLIKSDHGHSTFLQQGVSLALEIEGDAAMFSFSNLIVALYLMFGAPVLIAFGYGAYLATLPSGSSGSSSSSGSTVTFSSASSGSTVTVQNAPLTVPRGVPGPIVGAGLPVLAVGYGVYWLVGVVDRNNLP